MVRTLDEQHTYAVISTETADTRRSAAHNKVGKKMNRFLRAALVATSAALAVHQVSAASPPVESFARLPHMRDVTISPDGRSIAFISSAGDESVLVTFDRASPKSARTLFRSENGKYDIAWCNWANDKRVLCGLSGVTAEGGHIRPFTRLMGIDSDGGNMKMLTQRWKSESVQYQDGVIDWMSASQDTVLVELDEDQDGFPSVYELNINTGASTVHTHERLPIRSFISDGQGNVRLGTGYPDNDTQMRYFVRLQNEREWRKLDLDDSGSPVPVAIVPGRNTAYAIGDHQGRAALWDLDLTAERQPQLVFSHPSAPADKPHLTVQGQLRGVSYETDRPAIYYVDEVARDRMQAVNQANPGKFNFIADSSADEKVLVIQSTSDVDGGTYLILDTAGNKLQEIGKAYPELDTELLGRMHYLKYKAGDGTDIPAYLTVPPGTVEENLPLVVMPHDGPLARDSWSFSFLRSFLVSRGYAVLQMNYRGSSGYGEKWQRDAHQDWGGLTYADITDGARWAVRQGIADPKRVCIVGWGFGGYAALLSAARNGDLYKCSVSIGGISDLNLLVQAIRNQQVANDPGLGGGYGGNASFRLLESLRTNFRRGFSQRQQQSSSPLLTREQIGTSTARLRDDSPLKYAQTVSVPILLIHGDRDTVFDVQQSRQMAAELAQHDKPHRTVFIQGASHDLDRQSDRVTMLKEIEAFLAEHIGTKAGE